MPNRLLTPEEQRHAFDRAEDKWKEDGRKDIWEFSTLWEYIADEVRKAQDAKTLKAVGEHLDQKEPLIGECKLVAIRTVESLKRGEMPE